MISPVQLTKKTKGTQHVVRDVLCLLLLTFRTHLIGLGGGFCPENGILFTESLQMCCLKLLYWRHMQPVQQLAFPDYHILNIRL